jgi:two-component system phosphate regulon sensor histidine kinase PhoR
VFSSIRWRIAIPYAMLLIIVMAGTGLLITNNIRNTYTHNLENQLSDYARLISDELAGNINQNPQEINKLARHWGDILQSRVTIIAGDGVVLGDSHENPIVMDNHISRPEVVQALSSGWGSSVRFSNTLKIKMMYVAIPLKYNDQIEGIVRVSLPYTQIEKDIGGLQTTLLGITLVSGVLMVIAGIIISGFTTRPLIALTEYATNLAEGSVEQPHASTLIAATRKDEIGRLAASFRKMASQLQLQFLTLESERRKNSAVLQEMTDGVLIVDDAGIIQLSNPAVRGMLNIEDEKLVGRSLAEVLHHHQYVELWLHARETKQIQSALIEMSTKKLYIQCLATPMEAILPGNTLLLLQNLTRQHYLETVRRDFISNISHELRTPLASLKALTETLSEGALEDEKVAHRFLKQMEAEVDSLSHMVSELLELSRIESGQVPLKLKEITPLEVLNQAVERLQLQAERGSLKLSIDCPEDLPHILADPPRIEQVVINLLHNAIKFTQPGGSIEVSARIQNQNVLFSIKDTGVGIPAEDVPRIFERFYKTDRARSSGGTGLGLAIARHLVEGHGGLIWVESKEMDGSTFFFTIPQAK